MSLTQYNLSECLVCELQAVIVSRLSDEYTYSELLSMLDLLLKQACMVAGSTEMISENARSFSDTEHNMMREEMGM